MSGLSGVHFHDLRCTGNQLIANEGCNAIQPTRRDPWMWTVGTSRRYGSCRSLPWRLVGVGVPSLVGLLDAVLVAASPQRLGVLSTDVGDATRPMILN
jgi:hypothetical protein